VLSHRRSGSGPPLLLLHGIGLDVNCWEPVRPILERERDVIAIDLPGFGGSPMLTDTQSVPALATAVEGLIPDLGLERPHVAGNSLGGAISLELGARGAVSSVCALSPAGFAAGREAAYSHSTLITIHAIARALEPHAELAYGGPARRTLLMSVIVARPWRVSAQHAVAMNHATATAPGFMPTLPEVNRYRPAAPVCPATIAWGEHDRLLLYSRQAPRAERMLPGVRHTTLRGCGHVPMTDDPEQVASAILAATG
jgi:pimeloyl-ACP methyl ester carboxylesterase